MGGHKPCMAGLGPAALFEIKDSTMTKKLLAGSALGGFFIAGSVALAATAGHGPMRFDADANKDGNLTKAELTAALDKRFAQLDSNNDGRIMKEERDAAHQARF